MENKNINDLFNTLFKKSVFLHNEGRYEEAIRCYKIVAMIDPGLFDIIHLLGLCLVRSNAVEKGALMLLRGLRIANDTGVIIRNMKNVILQVINYSSTSTSFKFCAQIYENDRSCESIFSYSCSHLIENNNKERACDLLIALFDDKLIKNADFIKINTYLCVFEFGVYRHDVSIKAFMLARKICKMDKYNPNTIFTIACAANRIWNLPALQSIENKFHSLSSVPGFTDGSHYYHRMRMSRFDPAFFDRIETDHSADIERNMAVRIHSLSKPAGNIILVGCDSTYWEAYGDDFIASARQTNPEIGLHIHLADAPALLIDKIMARHPEVGVSSATMPDAHRTVRYACARFLAAPALARRYGAAVLITDIDNRILRRLDHLFDLISAADVALYRQPRLGLAREVAAGCVLFDSAKPAAMRWADLVARYISHFLERESPGWFLDQAALYAVWRRLAAEAPALNVRLIEHQVVEQSFDFSVDDVHAKLEAYRRGAAESG